jgi:hypothetical protein
MEGGIMATQEREQLREAFKRLFISQGKSEADADKLADVAADTPEQRPKSETKWVKMSTAATAVNGSKGLEHIRAELAERERNGSGRQQESFCIDIVESENLGRIVGRVR